MADARTKRITAIDVLGGAAVLGILLMNIQTFSMIESAYVNPTAYGEFAGVNAWAWGFTRIFADQKFMTLFSLLFGAGIVLMSEQAEANGRRAWAAHYRRMLALLAVGLGHAYLLWYGDILTQYALCGFFIYWARKWRPMVQFWVGLALLMVAPAIFGTFQYFLDRFPPETMQEWEQMWRPDEALVAWEMDVYRGSYVGQMEHRVWTAMEMHTVVLFTWFVWRVGGLMLIGMAAFKWKILGAYRSAVFYQRMVLVGFGIGLPLEAFGMFYMAELDWGIEVMLPAMLFNYFASLFVACGYVGTVMLLHQSGRWPKFEKKLSAVGRMAFTNYLTQTLICTTVFYGHGLGLFGYLERWKQLGLVCAVWFLQIAWSEWWLARFQVGPLEWVWRCATYLRVMPLRKRNEAGVDLPPVLRMPAG